MQFYRALRQRFWRHNTHQRRLVNFECLYITILVFIWVFLTLSGGENVYVAPYADVKTFYDEYLYMNTKRHTAPSDVAGRTTFGKALASLSHVRMLQARGSSEVNVTTKKPVDYFRNCKM